MYVLNATYVSRTFALSLNRMQFANIICSIRLSTLFSRFFAFCSDVRHAMLSYETYTRAWIRLKQRCRVHKTYVHIHYKISLSLITCTTSSHRSFYYINKIILSPFEHVLFDIEKYTTIRCFVCFSLCTSASTCSIQCTLCRVMRLKCELINELITVWPTNNAWQKRISC